GDFPSAPLSINTPSIADADDPLGLNSDDSFDILSASDIAKFTSSLMFPANPLLGGALYNGARSAVDYLFSDPLVQSHEGGQCHLTPQDALAPPKPQALGFQLRPTGPLSVPGLGSLLNITLPSLPDLGAVPADAAEAAAALQDITKPEALELPAEGRVEAYRAALYGGSDDPRFDAVRQLDFLNFPPELGVDLQAIPADQVSQALESALEARDSVEVPSPLVQAARLFVAECQLQKHLESLKQLQAEKTQALEGAEPNQTAALQAELAEIGSRIGRASAQLDAARQASEAMRDVFPGLQDVKFSETPAGFDVAGAGDQTEALTEAMIVVRGSIDRSISPPDFGSRSSLAQAVMAQPLSFTVDHAAAAREHSSLVDEIGSIDGSSSAEAIAVRQAAKELNMVEELNGSLQTIASRNAHHTIELEELNRALIT
ncbi:MAG: hypothetical protein AAF658_19700, partial [Myxococcota bacterium]